MSFLSAVPAQERAAAYTVEMAAACRRCKLRIGGHSKGGNLAAWAAIHIPENLQKRRLLAAYMLSPPLFQRDVKALGPLGDFPPADCQLTPD